LSSDHTRFIDLKFPESGHRVGNPKTNLLIQAPTSRATGHKPNDPLTAAQAVVQVPNDQQNQTNGAENKEHRENKTDNLAKDHEEGIELRIKLLNGVIEE
jgi:hypothetical protein